MANETIIRMTILKLEEQINDLVISRNIDESGMDLLNGKSSEALIAIIETFVQERRIFCELLKVIRNILKNAMSEK